MLLEDVKVCPKCGNTIEDRVVGVVMQWVTYSSDVLFWECPDCGGRWHRWPIGTFFRGKASRFIEFRTQ
jgi:uncharacterized protein with PIN domain